MDRSIYDTAEGIRSRITTLEGLHAIANARREAGYVRSERLNEYCILGRWVADACGNFCKIVHGVPAEVDPDIPDVVPVSSLEGYSTMGGCITWSHSAVSLPPVGKVCAHCGNGWMRKNAHDFVSKHSEECTLIHSRSGRRLGTVRKEFADRTDAVFTLCASAGMIRNDRYIDLRPHKELPELPRNERGWIGSAEGVDDGYRLQKGDEIRFTVHRCYHAACNRIAMQRSETRYFADAFAAAGFNLVHIALTAIPNEYCPCEVCAPWFRVATPLGDFVIGWRKRVISINWSGTRGTPQELFAKEDVTKDATSIHAWGKEKAIEYLIALRTALS